MSGSSSVGVWAVFVSRRLEEYLAVRDTWVGLRAWANRRWQGSPVWQSNVDRGACRCEVRGRPGYGVVRRASHSVNFTCATSFGSTQ